MMSTCNYVVHAVRPLLSAFALLVVACGGRAANERGSGIVADAAAKGTANSDDSPNVSDDAGSSVVDSTIHESEAANAIDEGDSEVAADVTMSTSDTASSENAEAGPAMSDAADSADDAPEVDTWDAATRHMAIAVSAGSSSACALTAAGGVVCWGDNARGELGNNGLFMGTSGGGGARYSQTPVPVVGLTSGATAVSVGDRSACALTAAGGVVCWGDNSLGQLGNNAASMATCGYDPSSRVPVPVMGLTGGVTAVSVGYGSACAITASGGVVCWGANNGGQLGNNDAPMVRCGFPFSPIPVPVTGLTSGVTAISVGGPFACALKVDGAVVCWGAAYGNGTMAISSVPLQIAGLESRATAVSAGNVAACAQTASGLVCWGPELAFSPTTCPGLTQCALTPLPVSGVTSDLTSLSIGSSQTGCAVDPMGGVHCLPGTPDADLGDSADALISAELFPITGLTSAMTAVSVGFGFACGLTVSGGIECWGSLGKLGSSSLPAAVSAAGFAPPIEVDGF